MAKKKEKKAEEAAPGAPAWMATFSDLMTQILCFFVFLTSMSTIDNTKVNMALVSFQDAFSMRAMQKDIVRQITYPTPQTPAYKEDTKTPGLETALSIDAEMRAIEKTKIDIAAFIKASKNMDSLKLNLDQNKMTVSLTNNLLFDAGSAELKPISYPVLYEIARALRKINNPILIEGHSNTQMDDLGIYPTKWELSMARALAVSRFLMKKGKVPERRFQISGAGAYKPVTTNATIEGRRQNRRVDIIILRRRGYF